MSAGIHTHLDSLSCVIFNTSSQRIGSLSVEARPQKNQKLHGHAAPVRFTLKVHYKIHRWSFTWICKVTNSLPMNFLFGMFFLNTAIVLCSSFICNHTVTTTPLVTWKLEIMHLSQGFKCKWQLTSIFKNRISSSLPLFSTSPFLIIISVNARANS